MDYSDVVLFADLLACRMHFSDVEKSGNNRRPLMVFLRIPADIAAIGEFFDLLLAAMKAIAFFE
jgi:hypothetical protein